MADQGINRVIKRIQNTYSGWDKSTTLAQMRQDWDALFDTATVGATLQDVEFAGVPCRWIGGKGADLERVVLYCHGGGFRMGSINSHQDLMLRIARAAGCRVLGVDYRLCPEVAYPAALNDVFGVYTSLLDQGFLPQNMAIAGDSAGGNLVGALLQLVKQKAIPKPAAAVFLSAWLDMKAESESYESRAASDPIHQRKFILALAKGYLGSEGDPDSPLTTPLNGSYSGMPPMLIQVGDCEVGLDESTKLAEKARLAGVDVQLSIWDGMIHAFQQFADELPEAEEAIAEIGGFLKKQLA